LIRVWLIRFVASVKRILHRRDNIVITLLLKINMVVAWLQGACAMWYNLLKNGEGDYSTRHAACPVLVGSKWGRCGIEDKPRGLTIRL